MARKQQHFPFTFCMLFFSSFFQTILLVYVIIYHNLNFVLCNYCYYTLTHIKKHAHKYTYRCSLTNCFFSCSAILFFFLFSFFSLFFPLFCIHCVLMKYFIQAKHSSPCSCYITCLSLSVRVYVCVFVCIEQ